MKKIFLVIMILFLLFTGTTALANTNEDLNGEKYPDPLIVYNMLL